MTGQMNCNVYIYQAVTEYQSTCNYTRLAAS